MTLKYYVTTVTNNVTSGKMMLYEPQKHGFLKKTHAFYRSSQSSEIENCLIINQLTKPLHFSIFRPTSKSF